MNPANVDPALLVPGAVIDMTPAWVPEGICACGCGRETSTIQYADASKGLVRDARRTEHLEPVTNRENLRRWREGRS